MRTRSSISGGWRREAWAYPRTRRAPSRGTGSRRNRVTPRPRRGWDRTTYSVPASPRATWRPFAGRGWPRRRATVAPPTTSPRSTARVAKECQLIKPRPKSGGNWPWPRAFLILKASPGEPTHTPEALAIFKEGQQYYKAGDMARAAQVFRRCADMGDAACQLQLGWHYDTGTGVARNDAEAVRWYHAWRRRSPPK